jgi:hypothetical protein
MARIILHIGTHKTGTTSIQRTLSKYRGKLAQRDIIYPDYSSIGRKSHYAHIGISNALANDHPNLTREDSEVFFSSLAQDASQDNVVLVSAESMYRQCIGSTPPQDAASVQEYWEMRHAYIRDLRALTGPAEIVVVLRNQADFAESMYQEHVKVTRYTGDFQKFLGDFWFHFQYYEQVKAWKQHFESVQVIPFEMLKGLNMTKRFLLALGLKPGRVETGEIQNVGMLHDGVILKRAFNGTGLNKDQLKDLVGLMTANAFCDKVGSVKRSFFADAGARRMFQQEYCSGNAHLIEMGRIADPSVLDVTEKEDVIYRDTVSVEKTARLIEMLCISYPLLAAHLAGRSGFKT